MALIVYGLIALALIVAYVVVTVTGHDGLPLLTLLIGFLSGAGTQVGLRKVGAAPPP